MNEKLGLSLSAKDFFSGDKKVRLLIAAGILGIALIFLSNLKTQQETPKTDAQEDSAAVMSELAAGTEEKLEKMVQSIQGAGRCSVTVMFENGVEYVYASDSKSNADNIDEGEGGKKQERSSAESNVIIVDAGKRKEALKVKEIQPKVRGVVVICDGGSDPVVKQLVTDAVTTALNISSAKVFVAKMTSTIN